MAERYWNRAGSPKLTCCALVEKTQHSPVAVELKRFDDWTPVKFHSSMRS